MIAFATPTRSGDDGERDNTDTSFNLPDKVGKISLMRVIYGYSSIIRPLLLPTRPHVEASGCQRNWRVLEGREENWPDGVHCDLRQKSNLEQQLLPMRKAKSSLHNRAQLRAKFYLMKAGLVFFPSRGTFVATEAGRSLLSQNPIRIDLDLLKQYPSFDEFYRGAHSTEPETVPAAVSVITTPLQQSTPEEQIEKAFLTI